VARRDESTRRSVLINSAASYLRVWPFCRHFSPATRASCRRQAPAYLGQRAAGKRPEGCQRGSVAPFGARRARRDSVWSAIGPPTDWAKLNCVRAPPNEMAKLACAALQSCTSTLQCCSAALGAGDSRPHPKHEAHAAASTSLAREQSAIWPPKSSSHEGPNEPPSSLMCGRR